MKQAISPLFQISVCAFSYLCATSNTTLAQVTADGTVNTQVNHNGNIAEITGGETRGSNLFHSFQDFSVTTGNEAWFNNANDISNIFSRVTGGNISNIDGLIRANGNASLFLINPAGILFGQGARLDLGGSFYGSTASSILFENGEFSAVDLDNPPLLTVNAPIGLSFRDNPGNIVNRSVAQNRGEESVGLEVLPEKNLTLVGGNINFEGGEATAKGGNIQLGGLSAAGIVGIQEEGNLDFPENVARANVNLSNAADVDVRGTGGGSITINAHNLNLEAGDFGSSQLRAGITADSTFADAQAGDIAINTTDDVTIDNSSILNQVLAEAIGNAGSVTITSDYLSLVNGGQISASTFGQGNGGSVIVDAKFVSLTEGGTIESITTDNGNAGSIAIEAQLVEITGNDPINNRSSGLYSSVGLFDAGIQGGNGNGGDLILETDSLRVTNGGRISADIFGTSAEAKAGSITINAKSVEIIGFNSNNQFLSGIFAAVAPSSSGSAGDVVVETETLLLEDGGLISTSTFGAGDAGSLSVKAKSVEVIGLSASNVPSRLRANVDFFGDFQSGGNGGDLTIETETLRVANGAEILANTYANGNAGSINITATDTITFDGQDSFSFPSAAISRVEAGAVGNAGGINITTGSLLVINGANLDASTRGQGNAGSITINANDTVILDGRRTNGNSGGAFSGVASEAIGDAGGINITTGSLFATNGGQVSTSTGGQGNAGSITINATDTVTLDGQNSPTGIASQVATGARGDAGGVKITTNSLNVINEGQISVSTFGEGDAGSLTLHANSVSLDNNASINAATQFETGNSANINLQITEDLTLSNNSFISASAFQGANGGNLSIDARFIIAFPDGNNDIIANAEQGRGGNITINAESLFGIQERSPSNLTNDINASSNVSGLDGTVDITTPDVNPIQGTTELPSNVVESGQTTAQACAANIVIAGKNNFAIKGKGGIPAEPGLPLTSLNVYVDGETTDPSVIPQPIETSYGKIQPARGVMVTESGQVILTAYRTDNLGGRIPQGSVNCGQV